MAPPTTDKMRSTTHRFAARKHHKLRGQYLRTFAVDPSGFANEMLALSPGMMVVGTSAALPFSPRAVDALRAARDAAREAGAEAVSVAAIRQTSKL